MLVEIVDTFLIVQLGTASVMPAVFTDAVSGLFQIAAGWMIAVMVISGDCLHGEYFGSPFES